MNKLRRALEQCFWGSVARLFFYPVTLLVTTPVRLIQTLWACRVLANGQWRNYPHFNPRAGFNSLFYWTAALNLHRFGRAGRSPYLGLGNYPLSRCFHYSLLSLYTYWVAGAITVLFGMFGWLLSHLVWICNENTFWVLVVIGSALISTTFYANTFSLQNYNVVGWMFFPIGLYGMMTGRWLVAGSAWFAASFGSATVVFLAGILSLIEAVSSWTVVPILVLLPASLKLLTHLWPLLIRKDLSSGLSGVMKAIGTTNRGVKYKRTSSKELGFAHIHYLFIYGQFFLISFLLTGDVPVLFLTSLVLFVINSAYIRFADVQSMYMLMFSLATALMMQSPELLLLPSFWILISPMPHFAGFPAIRHELTVVPKLAPFAIKPFLEGMGKFLFHVREGQRVLMVFDNPGGVYEKIFDGYRVLLELPLYVAAEKRVHFMPDFWGVFELNREGSPELWGRDVDSVQKNAEYWNADYVVVYQDTGTELENKWQDAGFELMSKFSWADYAEDLGNERPYSGATPDWWLLRTPLAETLRVDDRTAG